MSRGNYLFSDGNWFQVEARQSDKLTEMVTKYNPERLLNTDVDNLVAYFVQNFHIDMPALQEDEISSGTGEAEIDVSSGRYAFDYGYAGAPTVTGTEYEFHIPFTGDHRFFQVQPTSFSTVLPMANIRQTEGQNSILIYTLRGLDLSPEQVKADLTDFLRNVKQHLVWLGHSVTVWNAGLPGRARALVEERRGKLIRDRSNAASLGFKMREVPGTSRTFTAPEVRRRITPSMPPASSTPWKPEPTLDMAQYEHILKVIGDSALTMERSPAAFRTMGEEDIRTQMLFLLNGHYEGQATGETFNKEGKTDILIRSDGKNIFIGECKFWGGPKVLNETIDQLLGYTSWRDTKVAIIIFNRNKNFTAVLAQIQPTVEEHPNCKRFVSKLSDTQFRFAFTQKDDPNREMTVTVLAFDVPQP